MSDVFDRILGQPLVRDFLRATVRGESASSSYLFVGPSGTNKTVAASCFASALMCQSDNADELGTNCGKCKRCTDILNKRCVDVKFISPASASGYLVDQIRELIKDTQMSPIQCDKKIYIIDRVDMLGTSSANALLKTLEEPPQNVVFILLGRNKTTILPTILSRCIVVPFRYIPSQDALKIITQNTGCDTTNAKIALTASGNSITHAIEFLKAQDNAKLFLRGQIASRIFSVREADASSWTACKVTRDLLELVSAPNDEYLRQKEQKLADESDFLSKSALKEIEKQNKRELSNKAKESIETLFNILISILEDIEYCKVGLDKNITNCDFKAQIENCASTSSQKSITSALSKVSQLKSLIAYNISTESLINSALFEFRRI